MSGATLTIGDGTATTFNQSAGAVTLTGTLTINGGSTFNFSGGSVTSPATKNSGTFLQSGGAGSLGAIDNGPSGSGAILASGGTLVADHIRQGTLAISSAGSVSINTNGGNSGMSRLDSLSIGPNASLDLADNDLIVGNSTSKSAIEAYVATARHNGAWDTTGGITSTAAKNRSGGITGLGVMSGAEYASITGSTTFDGQVVASGDTLVKYTYNGDANFSGTITFDDYVRLDIGSSQHYTGWTNGDFNYSGSVNFDDYVLIDTANNQQSGTLARAVDWISGDDRSPANLDDPALRMVADHFDRFGAEYGAAFLAAVPEPTVFGVLLGFGVAFSRRRRRSSV